MDGDLQHPPSVIPQLLDAYERGFDVVYTVREDIPDVPWFKRQSARLYYGLLNRISKTPVHQGAADFRLVSRRVVELFQREMHERAVFLRGLFNWIGFRSTAVRFRLAPRAGGRSKYSLARMLDFAVDGIVSFSLAPLRLALVAGLLVAGLDLVAAAALVVRWAAGGARPEDGERLAGLQLEGGVADDRVVRCQGGKEPFHGFPVFRRHIRPEPVSEDLLPCKAEIPAISRFVSCFSRPQNEQWSTDLL